MTPTKKIAIALAAGLLPWFTLWSQTSVVPHRTPWQQNVKYTIDVTLTDTSHCLDGFITIRYTNQSPDTLHFIWVRCWPNAFKNDRTAFSEQRIQHGRTDFYFSDKSRKGYMNHLEFRVDGRLAAMADHPQYVDVIQVILPNPLLPGDSATLTTPFHVQLPDNFSHFGHHQGIYEITHWYPKPAVYDNFGWHPEPYLEKGGTYNDFGDYDIRITVPAGFTVAATAGPPPLTAAPQPLVPGPASVPGPAPATTTLSFHQSNIPDFVWFASRRYHIRRDTLQLPSGRIIDVYSFSIRPTSPAGAEGIHQLKDAIHFYSTLLGGYPYPAATVVETRAAGNLFSQRDDPCGAYPAIMAVDSRDTSGPDRTIAREVIDNWLSFAVGADGRRYPWMTTGLGRYYYNRYTLRDYRQPFTDWISPIPDTFHRYSVNMRVALREDQPVSTPSEAFTPGNYRIIAAYKTAIWMRELQLSLGTPLFDSCMHTYFRQQQSRQTSPEDLKGAFAIAASRLNIDSMFALLDITGPVPPSPFHRPLMPNLQFIPHPTHRNTLNISPAAGFNNYDHWMIGALIQNYNLPPDDWQLVAAPLYSPISHEWNGLLHFNYAWYPRQSFRLVEAGINSARFSTMSGTDSSGHAIFGGFYKVAPYFRIFFPGPSMASTRETSLEGKVFLIGEKSFSDYVLKASDSLYYPVAGNYTFRYLNQLTFRIRDPRTLYPYSVTGQIQQAAQWYRVNLDIHYFFNYPETGNNSTTGGLSVRLFGSKFGYLGARNPADDFSLYEPKLTAVRGNEDYTYDNYFIGRNDFNGVASQQIMLRDGDLKLRTDLFQGLQGRSDNWVAAINLNSTLPPQFIPGWLPLRLFLDVGTYAQAWSDNPPTSHFLYVGGFELDLLHNALRVYAPLVYSSDFSNQLKTVPDQNGFFRKLSFSIDVENFPWRKTFGYTPF